MLNDDETLRLLFIIFYRSDAKPLKFKVVDNPFETKSSIWVTFGFLAETDENGEFHARWLAARSVITYVLKDSSTNGLNYQKCPLALVRQG
ncbi:unnamed protein product [Didymodactylos carnosus]|uniref:Uncharacterized protein n=1 Tax=Didymodactylos carnosus TaxID=1234261 RepID=A0A814G5R4_9BILA|nr:unnamed protein product [Didymodactylos carnosus]CAF3764052.1 unnamed protein product [Didymodactylos carnosus]